MPAAMSEFPAGAVEALMGAVVVVAVLHVELQRRAGAGPRALVRDCGKLLRVCVPEAVGLLACLAVAAVLRARGDARTPDGADAEAWAEIKAQWPLLITADTLLSLQAMLRLVVLVSALLGAGRGASGPLADEASMLWLGAATARVALLARSGAYMLDGPLGGRLPAACEVAVLPVLLALSRRTLARAPFACATVLALSATLASRNFLLLAGDQVADTLFMASHSLDLLAAFAYLFRTVLIEHRSTDVSIGFAHLLMPVQQAMSAYYWLQAFHAMPELVGAGCRSRHCRSAAAFRSARI